MTVDLVKKWMQMSVRLRKLKAIFSLGSGLNMNEIWALGKIEHAVRSSGCGIGNKQIQEELQITKSAVSQIIDSLVGKGYADRAPDVHDRRRMCVTITPAGREVLKQLSRTANDLADKVAASMGEEKIQLMFDLMNEFIDGFMEAQSGPEDGAAAGEPECKNSPASCFDGR